MKQRQKTFIDKAGEWVVKNGRSLALAGMAAIAVGFGFMGYSWYRSKQSEAAHRAYVAAEKILDARILTATDQTGSPFEHVFTSEADKYTAAAEAFGKVYVQYQGYGIGVMAALAQVNALVKIGKNNEARTVLGSVISRIPSPSVKSVYDVTYATMLLESSLDADVARGVALLERIGSDANNTSRDRALYELGSHYWFKKDMANAQNYYRQLLLAFEKEDNYPSPWVGKAKEKLALLGG